MAKFNVSGIDELQKDLQKMKRKAQKLNGTHSVSFADLFTTAFMRKHTRFLSIDAFLKAGGFNASTSEEFEAIPVKDLDAYVKRATRFRSWDDMMDEAISEYALRQLGF